VKLPCGRVLAGGAAVSLAACNFAPDYHRPELAVPTNYKEAAADANRANADWQSAAPADTAPRGPWWEIYRDPVLNGLEGQVTSANQDIKAAIARFDQARAAASLARTAYFPTVTGNAEGTREQISKAIANARPMNQYNDFSLGADLSYEVDLWGRVRNSVAAAKDTAQASEADLAAVDLASHAELATDYFTLRGDDARIKTQDAAVVAYSEALDLTRSRYTGGAAAEADVDQAEAQLEGAKTQAADMRLQRAQLEHAIAILVGVPAGNFSLATAPLDVTPPTIAAGLPSTLLERRPDVAEAERQVAAANAQIGVAEAAFFPVLSLNAMLGLESEAPAHLFTWPAHAWSLGPSATLPLLDFGARDDLSDEAKAQYDQTVANYRSSVLGAYRDVEDNLVALARLADEATTQQNAVIAANRALQQAQYRYSGGIVTYLDVISAQNVALQAELSAADIAARRMDASVLLVKALGGGWESAAGLDLAKAPEKATETAASQP
jgi:NodT family efflux transporter outer membrane factor (OMF) lipoprotein